MCITPSVTVPHWVQSFESVKRSTNFSQLTFNFRQTLVNLPWMIPHRWIGFNATRKRIREYFYSDGGGRAINFDSRRPTAFLCDMRDVFDFNEAGDSLSQSLPLLWALSGERPIRNFVVRSRGQKQYGRPSSIARWFLSRNKHERTVKNGVWNIHLGFFHHIKSLAQVSRPIYRRHTSTDAVVRGR